MYGDMTLDELLNAIYAKGDCNIVVKAGTFTQDGIGHPGNEKVMTLEIPGDPMSFRFRNGSWERSDVGLG